MVKHKYNGEFTDNQIMQNKEWMRKQIYFLLLCVDPKTKEEHKNVDINKAFGGLLTKIGGINSLINNPPEMVRVMGLLEAALIEFNSPDFEFSKYRKLVLDAGSEVLNIKEVE